MLAGNADRLKWPKIPPALSPEQKERSDAYMELWHKELAGRPRYGLVEKLRSSSATFASATRSSRARCR